MKRNLTKIVLLEKVSTLGVLGDVVAVANGYARNYLIPFGKAKRATPENLKDFELKRAEYESKQQDILGNAKSKQSKIDGQVFTIKSKAGIDGKLFGSVNVLDIVALLHTAGVEVQKSAISLPHGAIKSLGEFEILITLHHDVTAKMIVNVLPE